MMGKTVLLHFWTHQRCCPQWEDWDTQPHNAAQLDHPAARPTAHAVLRALPWGSPPLPTQKFSAVPLQHMGAAAWGQQTGQSTLRPCRNNRTCMGAAGPARALPHKPAGQRHRSGLVGMSSGSRPELVQTALGESEELLWERRRKMEGCSAPQQRRVRKQWNLWEAEGLGVSLNPP